MHITELVAFVRDLELVQRPRDSGRLQDFPEMTEQEADALPVERTGVPPWVLDPPTVPVPVSGQALIEIEGTIEEGSLPEELRRPNAPLYKDLAHYKPFHQYREWGIFVRESGVVVVASVLAGTSEREVDPAFIEAARTLLLEHEGVHFQAEVACARAEVVSRARVYDAYFGDGYATAHEEAVANAAAYRTLRNAGPAVQLRARAWMKAQGPGYSEFDRWLTRARYMSGLRRATQHMLKYMPEYMPGVRARRPGPGEFLFEGLGRSRAPTCLIRDLRSLAVLKPFPKAYGLRVRTHSNDHPPPHIHIHIPPDEQRTLTRYEWPILQPLQGNPSLGSHERKSLDRYLADYGPKIDCEVRKIYPHVEPWSPATWNGVSK